jgi:hypothetical protein
MKKITLVKKILSDGNPCKKCKTILYKLEASGLIEKIDSVAIATEGDLTSEGYLLAQKYNQENAPFFIVAYENGTSEALSTYEDFLKIVLK